MIRQRLVALAVGFVVAAASACGGSKAPPGSSDPGSTGERISGSERLGWSQAASSSSELATFGYLAYVDNNRNVLSGVSCTPSGSGFDCSSRMPTMTPGAHTIQLASYSLATNVESARSAPIQVNVVPATAGAESSNAVRSQTQTTADGIRLRADAITDVIDTPTAIAFTKDGRMIVGARRGSIYIVSAADSEPSPTGSMSSAIELPDVYLTSPSTGGLLDIALDPDFQRNRFAYVLYTTQHADGTPQFTIARFREAGGRFGERATVMTGVGAALERPAGSIDFGRDGKLYAAFDAGGILALRGGNASYNGKVLRLNADGTTPDDQPSPTPILAGEYRSPRGLDWHPVTGAMWIADAASSRVEELRVKQARIPLPAGTGASSIAFYRGDLIAPFQGNLLVAAGESRALLRLRFDRRESTRLLATERLFDEIAGAVTTVAVGPDGAIYFGSDRGLFRITGE
jgi:quinoprotein glucose dehydrogenase